MRLLIVAATFQEIAPLVQLWQSEMPAEKDILNSNPPHQGQIVRLTESTITIDILITGPGMMHTAYHLGRALQVYEPDCCIDVGIAGSFDTTLDLGDVCQVVDEQLGDTGAESEENMLDGFDLGLFQPSEPPFQNRHLVNTTSQTNKVFTALSKKRGLTVNKVHGKAESIAQVNEKYQADLESMEGAAFFYACLMNEVPFYEIRAVSNYVESRRKEGWHIRKAIDNLSKVMMQGIRDMSE
jgi:futalosine hydrolase